MRATRLSIAALAAVLLTVAGLSTPVLAQDGYDQQQWWNPGDWFDDNSQYNLFSDRYWNDHQGYNDTWDYGYDYDWDRDYDYGYDYDGDAGDAYGYDYDWNPGSDYGYYDNWDYDSEYGYNDLWNDDDAAVGTTGSYESGYESSSDQ